MPPRHNQAKAAQLYKLLSFIDRHSLISETALRGSYSAEFTEDILFEKALETLIDDNLCKRIGAETLKITLKGIEWLEENQDEGKTPDEEDTSSESGPKKPYEVAKLKMEPKTLSIFQALRKIDKGEIDISPDFQRAFVWDETKQSRLIESILIRIPLPAFYLDATDQVKWSVVDGLQRLTTLHRFCNQKDFQLQNLQFLTELNGLSFDLLPKNFQVLLEDDTSLQFYNLMPGTPLAAKFTIFSRVNTGGMQLTPQEIRHALTQGPVTKWLKNIAHGEAFLSATSGAVESKRMSDRELVLRALAFKTFGTITYKEFGEFDGFLLYAMQQFNTFPSGRLAKIQGAFEEDLRKASVIFGRYAFRKFYEIGGRRSPINKALFETWVTAVSDFSRDELKDQKDKIMASFVRILNEDVDFLKSISSSTGSNAAVQTRFDTISALLNSTLR